MIVITEDWLFAHRTGRGGWSRDQCIAVGIAWPLRSGWKRRLIGTEITDEAKARFEKAFAPLKHTPTIILDKRQSYFFDRGAGTLMKKGKRV